MRTMTPQGSQAIDEIARRHGFSTAATTHMLEALERGGGTMAQFGHPEFTGSGQWMRGGMTMVSDMFNNRMKASVDALCNDLAGLLSRGGLYDESHGGREGSMNTGFSTRSGDWWPAGLGSPNSSGGQNGVRYAYFAGPRRLAIERDGQVTVYDTQDHSIGGVSQQQGSTGSLRFTSQHGSVDLDTLPRVS